MLSELGIDDIKIVKVKKINTVTETIDVSNLIQSIIRVSVSGMRRKEWWMAQQRRQYTVLSVVGRVIRHPIEAVQSTGKKPNK